MRIAISGTHRTGKITLVEELQNMLPTYSSLEEPYYLLEAEGHEFADLPSREDFELQLKRSVESIVESDEDQIFDRCPADFLAYLFIYYEPGNFDYKQALSLAWRGMKWLDLIVFVPIEVPDRMRVSQSDYPGLRRRVDKILRDILLGNEWEQYGAKILEVTGTPRERSRQVLARIKGVEK